MNEEIGSWSTCLRGPQHGASHPVLTDLGEHNDECAVYDNRSDLGAIGQRCGEAGAKEQDKLKARGFSGLDMSGEA